MLIAIRMVKTLEFRQTFSCIILPAKKTCHVIQRWRQSKWFRHPCYDVGCHPCYMRRFVDVLGFILNKVESHKLKLVGIRGFISHYTPIPHRSRIP